MVLRLHHAGSHRGSLLTVPATPRLISIGRGVAISTDGLVDMLTLPEYGPEQERMLRGHIRLLHRVYVNDVKTATGLAELHTLLHTEAEIHVQPVLHTHTPTDHGSDLEEWDW